MKKFALLFAAVMLCSAPASGQDSGGDFMGQNQSWSLGFYLWGTGMEGDIGIGPNTLPMDLSFSDILDELDFAFFGHLEWHSQTNNWGFMTDLSYLKLSTSEPVPFGQIATRAEMTWWEAALMYNLATRESPFDVFLGFRAWDADLGLRFDANGMLPPPPNYPPSGLNVNGGDDWVDVMFGGRWAPRIGEKWWLVLRADYATGDSDTLNLAGNFLWRFGRSTDLVFGWRYMDLDYSSGVGLQRRAVDVEMSGPVVALGFRF